ncbi:MAG TPA: hypothetical protein VF605_01230, partial [Allosphingosinicella sp.]
MPVIRAAFAAALAALAALGPAASPASAQATELEKKAKAYASAPADHQLITAGGVDLRTLRYDYKATDLAIGGGGEAGLELTRLPRGGVWGHQEPFANFTHNFDIMIAEKRVNPNGGNFRHGSGNGYRMIVRYGARSESFDAEAASPWFDRVSKTSGATLTYPAGAPLDSGSVRYTFTASDGTAALFREIGSDDCSSKLRCAYVSEILLADGTRLDFDYRSSAGVNRLRSVTSSRGYALLLEYGGAGSRLVAKACLFNLARRAMPAGDSCPADAEASAGYGYGHDGFETALTSSTDAGGGTSRYVYGYTGSYKTIAFIKPGQEAPWLTNSFLATADHDEDGVSDRVYRQDLAGGQVYHIEAKTAADETFGTIQALAGGRIIDADGHAILVQYGLPRLHRTLTGSYNPNVPAEVPTDGTDGRVYQITPGPTLVKDQNGRETVYEYCDPQMREFIGANDPDNCVVGALRHYTDPEGIRTEVTYDAWNNLTGVRRYPAPGSGLAMTETIFTHGDCGARPKSCAKPTMFRDPNGNAADYEYAAEHGGIVRERGAAVGGVRPEKRYLYAQRQARTAGGAAAGPAVWLLVQTRQCRSGAMTTAGDCAVAGDSIVTDYDYGADGAPGNLLLRGQSVSADGKVLRSCFAWDGLGRRIGETSPLGTAGLSACPAAPPAGPLPYTSATRYDSGGRVTGTIAPDPDGSGPLAFAAVRNSYDPAGRLVRVEQGELAAWHSESVAPSAWPGFTVLKTVDTRYDALDRKTREAVSGGAVTASVTQYSYDRSGRPRCTAVRMNPDAWASTLDDACLPGPPHPTFGPDRISKQVHDPAGQLAESWDGIGTGLQRREALYTYNGNGQRTSLTDARGYKAEMRYDGLGRQSCWIFPSGAQPGVAGGDCALGTGDFEAYTWDPAGNRKTLRKRDGSVLAFDYDALNRVIRKTVPERSGLDPAHTRDVFYAYDLRGLQTKARFDDPDGEGVSAWYDGFGRPVTTLLAMGGH